MENQITLRGTRGIQQMLFAPTQLVRSVASPEVKGVVYTKHWVVDLLLDLAGYRSENNLVDALAVEPSAGNGAFLGPMIGRLIESCRKFDRPVSDCQNSLMAYELDGETSARARGLAIRALRDHGVKRPLAEDLAAGWVRAADYLLEANIEADFVVGNPPYVRLEDIPEETASLYRDWYPAMRGRADLYVAFFEAALRALKKGGVCAFICADRWMRNQYGAELRELITSAYGVEVVLEMHNADAFHDEVDAYPAITVIRRQKQGAAVVASAGPEAAKVESGRLFAALQATAMPGKLGTLPQGLRTAVVKTWFKGTDPWPCHSPEQLALLRRLEDRFPALESSAKVGIGVATGNDGVFITKDASLVEPSRLLKLAVAKDIVEGVMKWSGNYLVDPWDRDGLVKMDGFPLLRAYFEKHANELKKRHTAARNVLGWYKTIDRVTHALTWRPKLYIADIKSVLDPVLDRGETYPHHNLYFVQSDEWDLEVLGGLLMSTVGQFFVEAYAVRMRGGYLRFQAQYLRRIRVPGPEAVSRFQSEELIEAFRKRDKQSATMVALQVYGIDQHEMEAALGR